MADLFDRGIHSIEQEQFWNQVASLQPDDEYITEFLAWDERLAFGTPMGAATGNSGLDNQFAAS